MITAPLLPFGRIPNRTKKAQSLVPHLVSALHGTGWRSARSLALELDTDDRTIREAAHLSEGRVISGQRGYCLTHQASVQDVQHAAAWLRHQATAMTKRALQIERAMHQKTA